MQSPSGSPAAAAAAATASYPRWVLLENRCVVEDEGTNSTGDAKTVAACRTSTGDPIRVSVRAAAPPAASSICVEVASSSNARIIAAHGDSVLFTVSFDGYLYGHHPDYFVYSAGAAAAAVPPSLSLLPPCYHAEKKNAAGYCCTYSQSGPVQRYLNADATGLLRRGEYGLVLASLMDIDGGDHAKLEHGEVCRCPTPLLLWTEWLILVDMKSKTLQSVCRYDQGQGFFHGRIFHPSRISNYLNSSQSFSDGASSVSKRSKDSEPPPLVITNQQLTDANSSNSNAASPEETILAVLHDISGLDREEMLRAYSILIHDQNGRRLRALVALPMTLRKDWLLMEIKTSEACSVCSACTANWQCN
ncbi:unnamed protein product [Urochloa decumbens]|uniref:Uncharacterized protein n=1 Tax=Urochloa decumbens TaxID=240449 RepID=A0ABC9AYY3_9POAL